jgi:hypothetical protein
MSPLSRPTTFSPASVIPLTALRPICLLRRLVPPVAAQIPSTVHPPKGEL